MALIDQALPKFEEFFREVYDLAGRLKFNNRLRQHLIAVSLLGSVIEIAFGILTLLKEEVANATGAWVLQRSLFEAFVDLKNIVGDSGYDKFMHANFLDNQRKAMNVAQNRGAANPYLNSLIGDSTIDHHKQWVESELQRLKDSGVRPLKVMERFDRAGELDLYDGPYALLSSHAHNNLGAIEQRHLDISSRGASVHYFREISDEDTTMLIDTTVGVLANSVAAVKSLLDGAPPTGLDGVTTKLGELRALWRTATS